MTFDEWWSYVSQQYAHSHPDSLERFARLYWNAAREDLLKEMYPLRQTNKEDPNAKF